jgi:hypothetical protein
LQTSENLALARPPLRRWTSSARASVWVTVWATVCARLRKLHLPITLFGESDAKRAERLRLAEMQRAANLASESHRGLSLKLVGTMHEHVRARARVCVRIHMGRPS